MDVRGQYRFSTELLKKLSPSPGMLSITYSLKYFLAGNGLSVPDASVLRCIKEALGEYGRRHLFDLNHFKSCEVTLIVEATGEVI